jgi:addiction module HigA family antidote
MHTSTAVTRRGYPISTRRQAVAAGPASQLTRPLGVPRPRVNQIVLGRRSIEADTALRLARFFGTSDRYWLNLQARYDLEVTKDALGDALTKVEPLRTAS